MCLTATSQVATDNSIHQFKVADISGNIFDFSELKGKKIMIVNTASKCGLTYQYESLQKLYSQYKNFNFVIIGFPSNDFLWQEPGSNDQIADFCEENYGVTFPLMSMFNVVTHTIFYNLISFFCYLRRKSDLNCVSPLFCNVICHLSCTSEASLIAK